MSVDATRVVEIIFNATNNTGRALSGIADNVTDATHAISGLTSPLADLTEKLALTQASSTALGLALLDVAVNSAGKFQAEVGNIASLFNGTVTETKQLGSAIQDFAVDSTTSIEKIDAAAYVAISTGTKWADVTDLLAVAEHGAVAASSDLETTTSALSRTMNAYGLNTGTAEEKTKNANSVMDALFVTVQNGDTTMDKLSAAIGRVASTAAAAGVPIDTLLSAIAGLTTAGINTDESVTLLNSLFKELLSPTDNLSKALGDVSLKSNGLEGVLKQLKDVTGGNAEQMIKLFSSTEAAKAAIVLANDNAGTFANTLTAMGEKTGKVADNYALLENSLKNTTQRMINAFEVSQQKIGAPLLDDWTAIVKAIGHLFDGISVSVDAGAFEPVFIALNGVQKNIADFINNLAKNLPEALKDVHFNDFISSFDELGKAIGLALNIDISSPKKLAAALQEIVNTGTRVNNYLAGAAASFAPFIQGIKTTIDSLQNLDPETVKAAGAVGGFAYQYELLKGSLLTGAEALNTIGTALSAIAGINAAEKLAALTAAVGLSLPEVAAAGLAIYGIYEGVKSISSAYDEYRQRSQSVSDAQDQLAFSSLGVKTRLAQISEQTGLTIKDMADFNTKVDEGVLVFDQITGKWQNGQELLRRISESTGVTVNSQEELATALRNGSLVLDETSGKYLSFDQNVKKLAEQTADAALINGGFVDAVNKVAESLGLANDKGEILVGTYKTMADAEDAALLKFNEGHQVFIRVEDGIIKLIDSGKALAKSQTEIKAAVEDTTQSNIKGSSEWERVMKVMQDATNSANDFKLKAEEITEKRYEANLSASVDLKVADIEAQTARIQAAFDSLNNGISSTGQTLGELAGIFANSGNLDESKQAFLKKLVEEEDDRRQQEFDLQKELIHNQNDYLKAKIERIKSGDSLITIESGDLAPELDALFEKVLKRVQIKATEEGFSLLLGLGAD